MTSGTSTINSGNIEIKPEEKMELLTFLLDREWYALPISIIKETLLYCKITSIPDTPNFLLGVINMRGSIIAVLDLRELFKLSIKEVTVDSKIIVLEVENKTVGIFVDLMGEVIKIPVSLIQATLSNLTGKKAEFLEGMYQHNEQIIAILNFKKIINSNDFQSESW